MNREETRRIHHAGYLIALTAPYDYRVPKHYVDMVLDGRVSEDDFWVDMRRKYPILPLGPIRRMIEAGAITPAPAKTATTSLVEDGWYWVQQDADADWVVAQARDTGLGNPFTYFMVPGREIGIYHDEVVSIGPMVPQYVPEEEKDHDHDDVCPLCASRETLDAMAAENEARRADRRRALMAEIAADPAAFVYVVEGYENVDDRSPVIMIIAGTLEKACERVRSADIRGDEIYEVTPHRIDADRTGEVVLMHFVLEDGAVVRKDGERTRS